MGEPSSAGSRSLAATRAKHRCALRPTSSAAWGGPRLVVSCVVLVCCAGPKHRSSPAARRRSPVLSCPASAQLFVSAARIAQRPPSRRPASSPALCPRARSACPPPGSPSCPPCRSCLVGTARRRRRSSCGPSASPLPAWMPRWSVAACVPRCVARASMAH